MPSVSCQYSDGSTCIQEGQATLLWNLTGAYGLEEGLFPNAKEMPFPGQR